MAPLNINQPGIYEPIRYQANATVPTVDLHLQETPSQLHTSPLSSLFWLTASLFLLLLALVLIAASEENDLHGDAGCTSYRELEPGLVDQEVEPLKPANFTQYGGDAGYEFGGGKAENLNMRKESSIPLFLSMEEWSLPNSGHEGVGTLEY
jgi:hypothetical protein